MPARGRGLNMRGRFGPRDGPPGFDPREGEPFFRSGFDEGRGNPGGPIPPLFRGPPGSFGPNGPPPLLTGPDGPWNGPNNFGPGGPNNFENNPEHDQRKSRERGNNSNSKERKRSSSREQDKNKGRKSRWGNASPSDAEGLQSDEAQSSAIPDSQSNDTGGADVNWEKENVNEESKQPQNDDSTKLFQDQGINEIENIPQNTEPNESSAINADNFDVEPPTVDFSCAEPIAGGLYDGVEPSTNNNFECNQQDSQMTEDSFQSIKNSEPIVESEEQAISEPFHQVSSANLEINSESQENNNTLNYFQTIITFLMFALLYYYFLDFHYLFLN